MLLNSILLSLLAYTAKATKVPSIDGFNVAWSDTFDGSKGSMPSTKNWNLEEWYKDLNGDWQEYTASPKNLQLSGNGILRIIPKKDSSATKGWTSGRIESKYTLTPSPNAKTIVQAYIRLGKAPASKKQGIWPAFWLLGDSHRNGGPIWPASGEIDIMEHVNGDTQGHAAVHCDKAPGGICNESKGIANGVDLPDAGTNWHVWRAVIDRTPNSWLEESVTFYLDGKPFHKVTGSRINDKKVWSTIAHNKMFFLLSVAVGGVWPQPPNESTAEGPSVGMEIGYVAHYVQNGAPTRPDSNYSDDDYSEEPMTGTRPQKGSPSDEYDLDYDTSPDHDDEPVSEPNWDDELPDPNSEPDDDDDLDLDPYSPLKKPKPGRPEFDDNPDFNLPEPPVSDPGFEDDMPASRPEFNSGPPDFQPNNDQDSDVDLPESPSCPDASELDWQDELPSPEDYDKGYDNDFSDSGSYKDEDMDYGPPMPLDRPSPESNPGFNDEGLDFGPCEPMSKPKSELSPDYDYDESQPHDLGIPGYEMPPGVIHQSSSLGPEAFPLSRQGPSSHKNDMGHASGPPLSDKMEKAIAATEKAIAEKYGLSHYGDYKANHKRSGPEPVAGTGESMSHHESRSEPDPDLVEHSGSDGY
ncbi:hypothetical protein F53441_771 [Fusarium austroafricanum]|uniref:GH16 domain-containing protein n=1 Tax=Fusarium austroafricanum TaxID=2364996 RepID=A0A8H4KTW0_9HYPO|nr:hypothetical protein F53441_771 [Fusarium austroafricanum]